MWFRRVTAGVTVAALLLSVTAGSVLAESKGNDKGRGSKVSGKFDDMAEFEWGLNEVVKLNVKGIFNGRDDKLFAPGAKITMQEAAVATLRLMDKEAEAQALTEAQVAVLLASVPDRDKIADWARKSVAALVKAGVVPGDKPFKPQSNATRLDVAVLLVKALGYEAEATAKTNVTLSFKDAHRIPVAYVGYVAAAVDHQLITGYDDKTFRPDQEVKRIEMAVMMGRADRLIDREKEDEFKGIVKTVNAAAATFTATVSGREQTFRLAPEASIFVNNAERTLADLKAGMKVEIKLNQVGLVVYVEAEYESTPQESTVSGSVTFVAAATTTTLALVSIDGVAYPVSPRAQFLVDGKASLFTDIRVGDTIKAWTTLGVVTKVQVQRPAVQVNGTLVDFTATTQTAPARLTVLVTQNSASNTVAYSLRSDAVIKVNGLAATTAGLRIGDSVALTVSGDLITKVEATRVAATVTGTVAGLTAATQSSPAKVLLTTTTNGASTTTEYRLAADATLKVNGQAAQWANLQVGDAATLTLGSGIVDKLEVTRAVPIETVINGSILTLNLIPPTQVTTQSGLGVVTIGFVENGAFSTRAVTVRSTSQVLVNGQAAGMADLRLGDTVKATLQADLLMRLEVTR